MNSTNFNIHFGCIKSYDWTDWANLFRYLHYLHYLLIYCRPRRVFLASFSWIRDSGGLVVVVWTKPCESLSFWARHVTPTFFYIYIYIFLQKSVSHDSTVYTIQYRHFPPHVVLESIIKVRAVTTVCSRILPLWPSSSLPKVLFPEFSISFM